MAKTITTTITHKVSYAAAGNNPLTIATNGAILAARGAYALSLASGAEWTVVNDGMVSAAAGYGIHTALATVVNTGIIAAGGSYGVRLDGNATLDELDRHQQRYHYRFAL